MPVYGIQRIVSILHENTSPYLIRHVELVFETRPTKLELLLASEASLPSRTNGTIFLYNFRAHGLRGYPVFAGNL